MRAGAITQREFQNQILDDMDLERERGITIKASAVTVFHEHNGEQFMLNFIDTPGHVDFHYEVQKALQACEGAILVVDATQGVQAQTVANAYAAIEVGLEIIPVINKIDLPSAEPVEVAEEIEQVLGFPAEDAILVSAKTGQGIDELISQLCDKLPPPQGRSGCPDAGAIFDSIYDDYRGVIIYVRVVDGQLIKGQKIRFMGTDKLYQITDLGKLMPRPKQVDASAPARSVSLSRPSRICMMCASATPSPMPSTRRRAVARLQADPADGLLRFLSRRQYAIRRAARRHGPPVAQ